MHVCYFICCFVLCVCVCFHLVSPLKFLSVAYLFPGPFTCMFSTSFPSVSWHHLRSSKKVDQHQYSNEWFVWGIWSKMVFCLMWGMWEKVVVCVKKKIFKLLENVCTLQGNVFCTTTSLFVGWLLNVPATCECVLGTDLLGQFYVLPHWDRSYRSNFPSHPVTVYWHWIN